MFPETCVERKRTLCRNNKQLRVDLRAGPGLVLGNPLGTYIRAFGPNWKTPRFTMLFVTQIAFALLVTVYANTHKVAPEMASCASMMCEAGNICVQVTPQNCPSCPLTAKCVPSCQ
ncbi:unnamed protein product [Heligmosomoides polygyrus]|uniref:BOWMAN_BIRK domain-containing protein n=1 Tax=Heligmosomoides polygyrus TaxID=6339 RepID=A0A183F253_HELPZ|nr:unnamed protein product [Heligmosomoides polygyrus]